MVTHLLLCDQAGQRLAATVHPRKDRAARAARELGNLGRGEPAQVHQRDRDALLSGQPPHRPLHPLPPRASDRLALDVAGVRQVPFDAGAAARDLEPAAGPPELVAAGVQADRGQPRLDPPGRAPGRPRHPGPQVRLLHQVLDIGLPADQPPGQVVDQVQRRQRGTQELLVAPPRHVPPACPPGAYHLIMGCSPRPLAPHDLSARTGSPRRAPELKNANPSSVPNTIWPNSSNGWLASSNTVNTSGAKTRKFTTYSSPPYSVPARAIVPLLRSLGTASANSAPNSADTTMCTTSPRPTLVVPAAIALSPLTMVEIIRSGMSAFPAVDSVNHMVTPANTTPATIPPTAPRSSLAASRSSCPVAVTTDDHLPMLQRATTRAVHVAAANAAEAGAARTLSTARSTAARPGRVGPTRPATVRTPPRQDRLHRRREQPASWRDRHSVSDAVTHRFVQVDVDQEHGWGTLRPAHDRAPAWLVASGPDAQQHDGTARATVGADSPVPARHGTPRMRWRPPTTVMHSEHR